jgi:hypothetical protein
LAHYWAFFVRWLKKQGKNADNVLKETNSVTTKWFFEKETPMADLSHITIEHAPNKTTYRAGDRFERYGMVVKAHYSDGTSS